MIKPTACAPSRQKSIRGKRAYQAGLAAETTIERHYETRGYSVCARRWRGASGEIDLIFARSGGFVMVEVKTSGTLDSALSHITDRQMARVAAASQDYLVSEGLPINTDLRIDVALVSANGQVETLENVTLH